MQSTSASSSQPNQCVHDLSECPLESYRACSLRHPAEALVIRGVVGDTVHSHLGRLSVSHPKVMADFVLHYGTACWIQRPGEPVSNNRHFSPSEYRVVTDKRQCTSIILAIFDTFDVLHGPPQ
jgi:hypothetical protein